MLRTARRAQVPTVRQFWSPKRRAPGTRPSRRSRDETRLSLEPSSNAIEDRFNAFDARDRFVDDRRQFPGADHVERARQRCELSQDIEEADRFRQQRQLVEPSAVLDRFSECVGMAGARIVRVPCIDCHAAQLENLLEWFDALWALLDALETMRAIPNAAVLAVFT